MNDDDDEQGWWIGVKYLGDNAINVLLLPVFKEMASNLEMLAKQHVNALSHTQIIYCQFALTVRYEKGWWSMMMVNNDDQWWRIGTHWRNFNQSNSWNWSELYFACHSRGIWEKARADPQYTRPDSDGSHTAAVLSSYGGCVGYLWSCNLNVKTANCFLSKPWLFVKRLCWNCRTLLVLKMSTIWPSNS